MERRGDRGMGLRLGNPDRQRLLLLQGLVVGMPIRKIGRGLFDGIHCSISMRRAISVRRLRRIRGEDRGLVPAGEVCQMLSGRGQKLALEVVPRLLGFWFRWAVWFLRVPRRACGLRIYLMMISDRGNIDWVTYIDSCKYYNIKRTLLDDVLRLFRLFASMYAHQCALVYSDQGDQQKKSWI